MPRGTLEEANRQYNEITAKYDHGHHVKIAIMITPKQVSGPFAEARDPEYN